MIRPFLRFGLLALLSAVAFGQTPSPAFDLADVHASPKTTTPNMSGGVVRAGRYELRKATLVDLIRTAYSVESEKVQGGPSWLDTDRFDVIAKVPPSTSPEDAKLMLQTLLADRFKLVVHTDTKSLSVFVLSLGKAKHKLKESEGTAPPNCQGVPQTPQPGVIPYNVVACQGQSTAALALLLPQIANGYVTSSVVDQTGLKGTWDFEIKWTGRGQLAAAGADGISLFDAVDKQLGLKLELQSTPLSVIKVDRVNQTPTPNPPGVATVLPPPPPAEFEVADIKPTAPGATNQILRLLPTGRLDAQNIPLKDLITLAWDFNSDDMFAGLPKSAESNRFDIVAKAAITPGEQIDLDALRAMLRKLLIDRFKMTTHMEDRPVSAYTLSAVKPKLTKADPSNRTGCKEGPGADGKDPRIANPLFNRLLACQNMTMAQFAEQLPIVANGYVHSAVLDATGLDGAYDFTLNFSGVGLVQGGGGGGRGGDAPSGAAASDPNGALSLPDAVSKQLGLKLELQKRPMPVLVIDHIEEKPIEN